MGSRGRILTVVAALVGAAGIAVALTVGNPSPEADTQAGGAPTTPFRTTYSDAPGIDPAVQRDAIQEVWDDLGDGDRDDTCAHLGENREQIATVFLDGLDQASDIGEAEVFLRSLCTARG